MIITAPTINQSPEVKIAELGIQVRAELLTKAGQIVQVTNTSEANHAILVSSEIKAHLKDVEATREGLKKPFLEMGRKIDAAAKQHVEALDAALRSINNRIGEYNAAVQAKRRADEEARQAEERRIAEELRKAEEERLKAEQKLADEKLKPAQAAKILEADLDRQQKEEELKAEQELLAEERRKAAELAAQPKGGMQREEIDVNVTDIHALYAAERACVRLAPDLPMIKAMIKAGKELPGVTFVKRAVFSAR